MHRSLAFALAVFAALTFAAACGGGDDKGPVRTVEVSLGELWVEPPALTVANGERLRLVVTNVGAIDHDLAFDGLASEGTRMLRPGESQTIEVGPFSAMRRAWCTVPGHRQAGMVMTVEVE